MICPRCSVALMYDHPGIPVGWIKCVLCGFCMKEKKREPSKEKSILEATHPIPYPKGNNKL